MDCHTIQDLLGLHAGGDLQPDQAAQVDQHLKQCATCRADYEEYRQAHIMFRKIAAADTPTLPYDFTGTVMAAIPVTHTRQHSIWSLWPRITAAACLLGLIGTLWYQVSRDINQFATDRRALQLKHVRVIVTRNPSIVEADRLAEYNVRGPIPLDQWEPSGDAGLFAILHKPDPENHPDLYSVDYLGEARRIEYRGDLWRQQRINRLTERTGSEDNIYIAEYPMPHRSVNERRATLHTLIQSFQPYYN